MVCDVFSGHRVEQRSIGVSVHRAYVHLPFGSSAFWFIGVLVHLPFVHLPLGPSGLCSIGVFVSVFWQSVFRLSALCRAPNVNLELSIFNFVKTPNNNKLCCS